jgi:hypothetical protein
MRRSLRLVALMAMLTVGCARTVSRQELHALEWQGNNEDLNAWWYMGSNADYHYLHNVRILTVRNVRIAEDQMPLKRTFPLTLNKKRWVRLPMGLCLPGCDVDPTFMLDRLPQTRASQ